MAMKFGIVFAAAALLASAAPLSAAPVKLTMWTQDRSGVTGALVDEFNKSQDKIEVELADRDFSSLVSDLTRAFATGNAPDIVEVDNPELSVFSSRNLLLDLTDRAEEQRNQRHRDSDTDRVAGAVDDTGEQVTPQVVSSGDVFE